MNSSPYIVHKKRIEEHIAKTSKSSLIFRLPIVVGRSTNPFTLTNFIYRHIVNDETFLVHRNACRFLIDIDDVAQLLTPIINGPVRRSTFNVHLDNRISVPDLVALFEAVLGRIARASLVAAGSCYEVDNSEFIDSISDCSFKTKSNYNRSVIEKYYG
jgi:nucleoside-diphosphate-sugar epimerase